MFSITLCLAAHLAPPAACVRDANYQPERDRQVQRRKCLGVAARGEWIDVGEYTRRDERHGQPADSAGVKPPLPDEIAGQEGQHEETQIAGVEVEAGVLVQSDPEERRHLDDQGRRHRKTEDDDSIRSSPRSWVPGIRRDNDELLPEAVRVLARELPGESVQVAHALHRHQERFIGVEPRVDQAPYLLAQMVFQLRYVDGVDRLPAAEVAPPSVDLLLERYGVAWIRHRSGSLWKWHG